MDAVFENFSGSLFYFMFHSVWRLTKEFSSSVISYIIIYYIINAFLVCMIFFSLALFSRDGHFGFRTKLLVGFSFSFSY